MNKMKRGDEDLADEHDPPRELGRRPAAHDGTDRDPRTGDATDHRVGRLASGSFEVAGNQRGERGNTSAAPMPSSTDHPSARTATVWDAAVIAEPHA